MTSTNILNSRLCKLEKELECMLKNADKITNIQKACFAEENTKCRIPKRSRHPKPVCPGPPIETRRHQSPKSPIRFSKNPCICKKKSPISNSCKNDSLISSLQTRSLSCPRNSSKSESHKKSSFNKEFKVLPERKLTINQVELCCPPCPFKKNASETNLLEEKERRLKAECDAHQMKTEIDLLRMQLEDLIQSKKVASDLAKDLDCKYNCLLNEKQEILVKLDHLQRENRNLSMKLEKEINSRKCHLQESQKTAEKTKEAIECKLEEIQLEAAKSSKIMAENSEKLAKTLKDKEKRLKQMCQKADELNCLMEEKDNEIAKISKEKRQLEMCLEENKLWNKKLREVNDKLAETVKEYYNNVLSAKNETECLKDEIKYCKERMTEMQNNQVSLKEELEIMKTKTKCQESEKNSIEQQLSECQEKEKCYQQKIKSLNCDLEKLEENHRLSSKQTKSEMQKLVEEHCKLKSECTEMQKKLAQFRVADEKRRKCIEEELRLFTSFVNEKESILLKEKEELSCLVNELTSVIKQHKMRISELSKLNKQQEEMLECQSNKIAMQEKSLEHKSQENECLNIKTRNMEGELKKIKKAMEEQKSKEDEEINDLQRQLSELKSKFCEEKKNVACKEKTIQNQNKTICELKTELNNKNQEAKEALCKYRRSCEDLRRQSDEMKRILLELEYEKKEKSSLIEELKEMECKQKNLENKVSMLEKTVEKYYNCTSKDITKKEEVINCLQQEISRQQAEFAHQRNLIQQEKEQAICAAKLATQKLYDTVTDFQQQVETQKKVQQFLTCLLYDKEGLDCRTLDVSGCLSPTDDDCSEKTGYRQDKISCCSSFTTRNENCKEIDEIFPTTQNYSSPVKLFGTTSTCLNMNNSCGISGATKRKCESDDERNEQMKNSKHYLNPTENKCNNLKKDILPGGDICNKFLESGRLVFDSWKPCSSSW